MTKVYLEQQANKDAANGYAGLDVNAKHKAAQIPFGTVASTVADGGAMAIKATRGGRRIACIGDSQPCGDTTPLRDAGSNPLGPAGYGPFNLINGTRSWLTWLSVLSDGKFTIPPGGMAGHNGDDTSEIAVRQAADVINVGGYHYVFWQMSTHDAGQNWVQALAVPPAITPSTTFAGLAALYDQMLAAYRAADIQVILLSTVPRPSGDGTQANDHILNAWAARWAERNKVPFVDVAGILCDPTTGALKTGTAATVATTAGQRGIVGSGTAWTATDIGSRYIIFGVSTNASGTPNTSWFTTTIADWTDGNHITLQDPVPKTNAAATSFYGAYGFDMFDLTSNGVETDNVTTPDTSHVHVNTFGARRLAEKILDRLLPGQPPYEGYMSAVATDTLNLFPNSTLLALTGQNPNGWTATNPLTNTFLYRKPGLVSVATQPTVSPWNYVNRHGRPVTLHIIGGTVTNVLVNGSSLGTPASVSLRHNDVATIVYSAAPTLLRTNDRYSVGKVWQMVFPGTVQNPHVVIAGGPSSFNAGDGTSWNPGDVMHYAFRLGYEYHDAYRVQVRFLFAQGGTPSSFNGTTNNSYGYYLNDSIPEGSLFEGEFVIPTYVSGVPALWFQIDIPASQGIIWLEQPTLVNLTKNNLLVA